MEKKILNEYYQEVRKIFNTQPQIQLRKKLGNYLKGITHLFGLGNWSDEQRLKKGEMKMINTGGGGTFHYN